jgi:hypothetical protein
MRKVEADSKVIECHFKPLIHENKIKNDTNHAHSIVVNPESYDTYINKKQKIREDVLSKEKKIDSTPGSGKIWKSKITVPRGFSLSKSNKSKSIDFTNYSTNTSNKNIILSHTKQNSESFSKNNNSISVKNTFNIKSLKIEISRLDKPRNKNSQPNELRHGNQIPQKDPSQLKFIIYL